jgi:nucleotide-binding universal stress UspA family protein
MTGERHDAVVAGVDGSAGSVTAAYWAAQEALHRHVPLRVVYAYLPAHMYRSFGHPTRRAQPAMTLPSARHLLAGVADRIDHRYPELEIDTAVIEDLAADALVHESRTASLVVVGATGRGDLVARVTGSVATEVAARAHATVVVVRPPTGEAAAGLPVVVGVDGSGTAAAALEYAFDVADARRVPLLAVHVRRELPDRDPAPGPRWRYRELDADSEAHRLFTEQLATWREKYPEVAVDSRVVYGFHPAVSLSEASEGASLLVIGCRGHGTGGPPLGSVSRALVHHAHCSVAIVHPPESGGQP